MDSPLLVEVIAYAPTAFYHCTHCEIVWREAGSGQSVHQEQLAASLPDDLTQQYQEISNWAADLFQQYQDRIALKVIDAASLEGVFKSIQYGARRFPAVIVHSLPSAESMHDHRARFNWSELPLASAEIARWLSEDASAGPAS